MLAKATKTTAIYSALCLVLFSAGAKAADVKILDKTHHPAANFLAYTEFELSGEPLAESLGLDLDYLDPFYANSPTQFDFAAGIASYEYSEEAMYALNYQSGMGPHLVNGPRNQARGGKHNHLQQRIESFAVTVGMSRTEIPDNLYPISLPYISGSPEFAQQPDIQSSASETVEIMTAQGNHKKVTMMTPNYSRDYRTLAWNPKSFVRTLNPAAIGAIFLKEVMWAQDFLGGMHVTETDKELAASTSKMDHDEKYSLGVSAADGFNGLLLTELSLDKLLIMQQQLGFNGHKLGVPFTPEYSPQLDDPNNKPIWFAHKVAVHQGNKNKVNSIDSLSVIDAKSTLRDTWQLLWPMAEFYAFTDQRKRNNNQNPAMLAAFDGAPFASAPKQNVDDEPNNDIAAHDAFSLANNLSNLLFKNMVTLHFNHKQGTFVSEFQDGKQGQRVDSYDAAYSIVALSIFQRAKDALPVGYASATASGNRLNTAEGKQALALIKQQADFIIERLIDDKGLVADGLTLTQKYQVDDHTSLPTQFAAIRGLVAAFLATQDQKYKNEARKIYIAVEQQMFDSKINTWATEPGTPTVHTPYTAAAISGGLRETILHLKNEEGEHQPALELQRLVQRYVSWFNLTINGGLQLAEPLTDTGEIMIKNGKNRDTDEDGVMQITAAGGQYGTAPVMANKVVIQK